MWNRPQLMKDLADLLFVAGAAAMLVALVVGVTRLPLFPIRDVVVTHELREVRRSEVERALAIAGERSDNVTVIALEWETPSESAFQPSGFTETQMMSDEVFASTIQSGGLDPALDDLDDDAIERSIAEINEAIQRTASRNR